MHLDLFSKVNDGCAGRWIYNCSSSFLHISSWFRWDRCEWLGAARCAAHLCCSFPHACSVSLFRQIIGWISILPIHGLLDGAKSQCVTSWTGIMWHRPAICGLLDCMKRSSRQSEKAPNSGSLREGWVWAWHCLLEAISGLFDLCYRNQLLVLPISPKMKPVLILMDLITLNALGVQIRMAAYGWSTNKTIFAYANLHS